MRTNKVSEEISCLGGDFHSLPTLNKKHLYNCTVQCGHSIHVGIVGIMAFLVFVLLNNVSHIWSDTVISSYSDNGQTSSYVFAFHNGDPCDS